MLRCGSDFDLSLYPTGSLTFHGARSFTCGRGNLLTMVFILLSLPYAPVGQTQCKEMELLLLHLGLPLV